MHFIHEIIWFECFLHRTFAVFQNFSFSRISINRMCFSTDRKSLEFLSLVLPSSIALRLVLDQSKLFFSIDWILISTDWKFWFLKSLPFVWLDWYPIGARSIEFRKKRTKMFFPSCVHHFFIKFFYLFLFYLSWPVQSKLFCCFLPQNFQRFLSTSIAKTEIPFLFHFNYIFHAFY